MTGFVNEVTADGASIHHSSQSPDNDASHLYLQPPSAICWQMAPPTRGHSELGLTERTPPLHDEQESCQTYSVQFAFISANILLRSSSLYVIYNYKIRRKSYRNKRKWQFLSNVVIIIHCQAGNHCECLRKNPLLWNCKRLKSKS